MNDPAPDGPGPAMRSLRAGLAYFAVVFAAGFALGTLRVLLVSPHLGETGAVLLELPVMLALSWLACRALVACFDVPARPAPRLLMGAVAFGLLMLGELGVALLVFGRTLSAHLQHYGEPGAMLGLAGQLAFAAFPLVQIAVRGGRR